MKYILASQSPRRKELLGRCKITFTIEPAKGEEQIIGDSPEEIVQNLALAKAQEIADQHRDEDVLVIGADTVVVYEEQILGKPQDKEELISMIRSLQGNTHKVYTGVALIHAQSGKVKSFAEETKVRFFPMTEEEIISYEATGDGYDKAGGYGIQSEAAIFIAGIEGDYNNVVGLPIARLYRELQNLVKIEQGESNV